MSNQVYANNMEVSCKAAAGKSICAFPDVCFTPPQTPATPPGVPIPYPNTGLSSDTSSGSTTVKISGQEVMLKNKSYFKKSTGDEAGSAPLKGIVTHKNTGKVYFNAWSMNVMVEGENVVRHLDLTTHNHGSFPGNSPAWPYVDAMAMAPGGACHDDVNREKEKCKDCAPHAKPGKDPCAAFHRATVPPINTPGVDAKPVADRLADESALNDCLSARKCLLQPYSRKTDGKGGKALGCCKPQTGHHLIEKSSFLHGKEIIGGIPSPTATLPAGATKFEPYDENMAPCVCAEGTSHNRGGTHELLHVFQKASAEAAPAGELVLNGAKANYPHVTTYGEAKKTASDAHAQVFPTAGCSRECIENQLDAYHKQCGITDDTKIKAATEGINPDLSPAQAQAQIASRKSSVLLDRMTKAFDTDAAFLA
ncbi:PAAR-like domain-containing protein [Roseateles sp. NT4]|uniref:PAAR-like domain-containing protein n=1 Tax=Roseateles sp. NT4 TaxID=3453715 RepID=UPI003EE9321E